MKKYVPIVPTRNANALKVEVYYTLGGTSYATYKNVQRGYYLSVTPVERGERFESFVAFTGTKLLILPCTRRSVKQEARAIELAQEHIQTLIQHVLRDNNLQLIEPGEEAS